MKEEQLDLIDVDTPELKEVKRELKAYDSLIAENKENSSSGRKKEKEKRVKVLEKVVAAKLKPDGNGVYKLRLDGKVWEISQEAQLKIRKHAAKDEPDQTGVDDGGGEGEEGAGGGEEGAGGREPPLGRRAPK